MTIRHDYNATLVRRHDVRPGLMMVWIRPDGGPFAPFAPGQFVSIGRIVDTDASRSLIKRAYSIGSSAEDRDLLQLFVVHVDDGEFTDWFFARREGDRVWLSPRASGGFTLDGFTHDRDLVLVSTGTAVAPYVSMYRTHREAPPWRRIVIINGVRESADLGFHDELTNAAASDARLVYLPMTTREPEGSVWRGLRGRVSDALAPERFHALARTELSPGTCHVYLCGNPAMIESAEASLVARGFRRHTRHHPGNLHLEKYWAE